MATKEDLKDWVVEALKEHGGEASLLEVARTIWDRHEDDLRASGDLFYTWQYDMRWAATKLREEGLLQQTKHGSREPWRLT